MDEEWRMGSLALIDNLKSSINQDFQNLTKSIFGALRDRVQVKDEDAPHSSSTAIQDSVDDELEIVNDTESVEVPALPPKAALYRPPLEVGKVYIVKKINSRRNIWTKALILSIIYNVQHGVTKNRCMVKFSDGSVPMRHVDAAEVAYFEECSTLIPIGTAVVTNVASRNALHYQAGVVLEQPNALNQFRYLIFLDKGTVCYTQHQNLRVICDVYQENTSTIDRYFIRDMISLYPDRFSLRFKMGEKVVVKRKGDWIEGTVQAIDCSILQLQFPDGTSEWYPRGSYKFKRVLDKRPSTSTPMKYLQRLQYSRAKVNLALTDGRDRGALAVKRQVEPSVSRTCPEIQPKLPRPEKPNPVQVITPLLYFSPRDLGFHTCNETCVGKIDPCERVDPSYGPLVWPLCAGFKRVDSSGGIVYKAPCGLILRNYRELRRYLNLTKINLNYDHFDFSARVNARRIYQPNSSEILVCIDDISNGLEKTKIPCINEVNNQIPEPITYLTTRKFLTYSDELLNNDGNFLSCCSCEDDCQDSSKCECVQLTIKSYQEIQGLENPLPPSEVTYQYKRLLHGVQSGIYECNTRCKCSSACSNRLVQFPLSVKLQLFQTGKKGWGVRALHDLPKGSFVCTYVGYLLNEREANEWGILHGDEYLSDLDFIQTQESSKPGYEETVAELFDTGFTCSSDCTSSQQPKRPKIEGDSSQPKRRSSRVQSLPTLFEMNKKKHKSKKRVVREFPKNSLRNFFPDDFTEFTIDAKNAGNIGRYFNHACDPNMFVQNVFVDTHDLRLPWVAFFTKTDIPAGTELTWDYGYSVGSVAGKRLYCYCLANSCKRRLY